MHNLFSYNFSFVLKGIRLCFWRTKQLNIGGTNLTNVQYANIGNQIEFIDTMKYYQQSLSSLAKNASKFEQKILGARFQNLFRIMKLILDNLILW